MSSDSLNTLKALNERFILNFITNDVESHDAIIHDRFLCIMPNGGYQDWEAYLRRWATAFDPNEFVYFDYRDESVSIFGNVALVRAATKYVHHANGTEQIGMNVYTDTYLEEKGKWKCIQAHLTPVSAEHYPGDDTIVRAWVNGCPEAG
ncbi:MAG: DUF4440 domain-containing protein [Alphaproteobacteria bacterium]|nr:DUF4440 domain-containing protein [Alphaproteobacteria bacterium]